MSRQKGLECWTKETDVRKGMLEERNCRRVDQPRSVKKDWEMCGQSDLKHAISIFIFIITSGGLSSIARRTRFGDIDVAMSGAGNREAVFPTRMNLTLMKTKLKGANTGHSLLKRKSEALTKRFREITRRIDTAKRKMGRVMQIASFSLAEVTYAAGDLGYLVQESVKSARFRVRARQENVR
jgi:hypothetical protein